MARLLTVSLFALLTIGRASSQAAPPAVSSQSSPAALYKLGDGPHEVTSQIVLLNDSDRDKKIYVRVTFPRKDGPFPVIVFSHGAGGSADGYLGLTHYWATHGYVCLQPTHDDSLELRHARGDSMTELGVIAKIAHDPPGWIDRAQDISFVLDSFPSLEKTLPELQGKLDSKHIGMAGHSYGAYTTGLIGGAEIELPDREGPQFLGDDRVSALLMMSGQGPAQMGLTRHSWDKMKLPLMAMTGSLDRGMGGQNVGWRESPYDLSPPGDKYLVFIEGARHISFSGIAAPGEKGRFFHRSAGNPEEEPVIFDEVKSASLAFWDAYLKQDKAALAYLNADAMSAALTAQ